MSITKCNNKTCPLAVKCYRATSKPNPIMQAYDTFEQLTVGEITQCDYYMSRKFNK